MSTNRISFRSSAAKINLVSAFIFYLLVLNLQGHEISYFFGTFILFLDLFEVLSHHPTDDSLHWIREEVQRIIDRVFREELTVPIALTFSSGIFN